MSCELDTSVEAPRVARQALDRFLGERTDAMPRQTAALLVSELVTNAIQHGGPPIRVDAQIQHGQLRVAVHDAGDGTPAPTNASSEATSGRGLDLVAASANDWGVEFSSAGFGKAVWFELALTGDAHPLDRPQG